MNIHGKTEEGGRGLEAYASSSFQLCHAEKFSSVNVNPPRGVLLCCHGLIYYSKKGDRLMKKNDGDSSLKKYKKRQK